jgi:integrase
MSLYRRKPDGAYWVRICVGGEEIRKSTGTKDRNSAEAFEKRERERSWRVHKLGDPSAILWGEAAARWQEESKKRSSSKDEYMLAWFAKHINDKPLSAIDRQTINLLRELLKKEGSSAANVDRYFALLRAILRKCRDEWDYLETVPKVPMFNARPAEPRWLSHAEFDQLVSELPPHMNLAARFAVLTGLRMRSMLALTWNRVDMTKRRAWIPPSQMKSGHAFGFPLSSKAVTVLRECRMLNPRGEHVFQYGGKSIDDCNTAAFAKAGKRAGLESIRWHDLRHYPKRRTMPSDVASIGDS